MLSSIYVALAVLAISFTSAAPHGQPISVDVAMENLFRRANPAPVSCGPINEQRSWPLQSVQGAYDALVNLGNTPAPQRPVAGTRFYPRQYGNPTPPDPEVVTALNAIPECATGQTGMKYFEFPITDPTFAGGVDRSQGPGRVIAISPSPGQGG